MSEPESHAAEGEHRLLTIDDLKAMSDALPQCEQCHGRPKLKLHIGFYDPLDESDAPRSGGYYRDHLCFQCYVDLLHAYFCTSE